MIIAIDGWVAARRGRRRRPACKRGLSIRASTRAHGVRDVLLRGAASRMKRPTASARRLRRGPRRGARGTPRSLPSVVGSVVRHSYTAILPTGSPAAAASRANMPPDEARTSVPIRPLRNDRSDVIDLSLHRIGRGVAAVAPTTASEVYTVNCSPVLPPAARSPNRRQPTPIKITAGPCRHVDTRLRCRRQSRMPRSSTV